LYQKLLSNAQEVKARQGHLIVFAFEGQEELISLADTVFIFSKQGIVGATGNDGRYAAFCLRDAKSLVANR